MIKILECKFVACIIALLSSHLLFAADASHFRTKDLYEAGAIVDVVQVAETFFKNAVQKKISGDGAGALEDAFMAARHGFVRAIHFLGTLAVYDIDKANWFALANEVNLLEKGELFDPSFKAMAPLVNNLGHARLKLNREQKFIFNAPKMLTQIKTKYAHDKARCIQQILGMHKQTRGSSDLELFERSFFLVELTAPGQARFAGVLTTLVIAMGANFPVSYSLRIARVLYEHGLISAELKKESDTFLPPLLLSICKKLIQFKDEYSAAEYSAFSSLFAMLSSTPSPEAYYHQGQMLSMDLVDLDVSKDKRCKFAELFFEKSATPESFFLWGSLYEAGELGKELSELEQVNRAINLYRKSTLPAARKARIILELYIGEQTGDVVLLAATLKEMTVFLKHHPRDRNLLGILADVNFTMGLFCKFSERERAESFLDVAEDYAIQAIILGEDKFSQKLLRTIVMFRETLNEFSTKIGEEEETSSSDDEDTAPQHADEPVTEVVIKCNAKKLKKERASERHKQEVGSMLASMGDNQIVEMPTLSFVNNTVRDQFASIKGIDKMQELFLDIAIKPWGTEGSGKPEILRNGQYAGCISRRINHKDRLVYRALSNNEIIIYSCQGHYPKN